MRRTWILMIFFGLVTSGCGASMEKLSSLEMPGGKLNIIKKIYVNKLEEDTRDIHLMIKDELVKKGYEATTEQDGPKPENVDGVIVYADRWAWDITMFMYQLTILIKNPEEDLVLGAGKSIRATMARKEPNEMIKEVLDSLLDDKL